MEIIYRSQIHNTFACIALSDKNRINNLTSFCFGFVGYLPYFGCNYCLLFGALLNFVSLVNIMMHHILI